MQDKIWVLEQNGIKCSVRQRHVQNCKMENATAKCGNQSATGLQEQEWGKTSNSNCKSPTQTQKTG